MINFSIAIAIITCVCCCSVVMGSGLNRDVAWTQFKMKHLNNPFSSSTEEAMRKSLFLATDEMIQKHNSDPTQTFLMSHNKFSIMTDGEKKQYRGYVSSKKSISGANYVNCSSSVVAKAHRKYLAASVDWRNDNCMLPIVDQGDCGSCWAFSAVAVIEFDNCVITCKKVPLSQQQLIDCSTSNFGCTGGNAALAWKYVAERGGINTAASYPYTGQDGGVCKFKAANIAAKISTNQPCIQMVDIPTAMAVLQNKRLVAVVIYSSTNAFTNYASGVFSTILCGKKDPDHQVVVVGYGTTLLGVDYWIIRNSWSADWGINGYGLFKRGVNMCQIESEMIATNIVP